MKAEKGFTIVELLIVIVVIGILAAIVIVAYNGVTQRAKTSKAQAAASAFIKKAEAYNADSTAATYPTNFSNLSTASSTATYYLSGVTLDADGLTAAPAVESTVSVFTCSAGAPDTTHIFAVQYWDYSTNAAVKMYYGGATSSSTCNTAVAS